MTVTNNDAQASLIAHLSANATILALHSNFPVEIREENWLGEDFLYPNIRVMCEVTFAGQCGPDEVFFNIRCFSEQKSSKQSQLIAGTVAKQLHNLSFTLEGVRWNLITIQRTPRATQESGVWRAEVQGIAKVTLTN